MQANKCVDNGEIYTNYLCPTCQEYKKKYVHDEYYEGNFREDLELWEQVREQIEGKLVHS